MPQYPKEKEYSVQASPLQSTAWYKFLHICYNIALRFHKFWAFFRWVSCLYNHFCTAKHILWPYIFAFLGPFLKYHNLLSIWADIFAFLGLSLVSFMPVYHLYTAEASFLALIFAFLALFFTSTINLLLPVNFTFLGSFLVSYCLCNFSTVLKHPFWP